MTKFVAQLSLLNLVPGPTFPLDRSGLNRLASAILQLETDIKLRGPDRLRLVLANAGTNDSDHRLKSRNPPGSCGQAFVLKLGIEAIVGLGGSLHIEDRLKAVDCTEYRCACRPNADRVSITWPCGQEANKCLLAQAFPSICEACKYISAKIAQHNHEEIVEILQ